MTNFADIDRNPDAATLVSFRKIVLGGGAVVALLLRYAGHRPLASLVVGAITIAVCTLSLLPGLGKPIYVGWMFFGVAIGTVTSPIVLGLVWLLVFVPSGLLMRLSGKDPMKRRFDPATKSYWEAHPPPGEPRSYFRQF